MPNGTPPRLTAPDAFGPCSSPLIAYWPSVIRGASVHHQPAHVTDIMATCLDLARAEYPKTYKNQPITPLEGESLRPTFEGKARAGHDAYYWEHEGSRAIRRGKWKLVSKIPDQTWELYDMETDWTETHDLRAAEPERAKLLQTIYKTWADRVGVVLRAELKRLSTRI